MKKKTAAKNAKKKTKITAKKATRTATKKKTTASKTKKKMPSKKTATRAAAKSGTKKKTTVKTTAKKVTAKKTTKKKTIKKPVGRKPAASTAPKVSRPVAPMRSSKQPPTPSPAPSPAATVAAPAERPLGVVTHYYSHLGVAVVQLNEDRLHVGEIIHIKGHTTDLQQPIESIEIDHQSVQEASAGQVFGLKVRDHVREHDQIFKVSDQS